ncbi:GcvT family protein [Parasulfitobacter algicola]|uniref:GcvT family protein n=1 Tax=Parasulfitobacter algicola TaxID=2614809 RepID=A0ABX2IY06_9RHOB|nr:FAD-dependent oxidoreductase [Sulfitobacter algicola]NSX55073.1 GcvT family protein [Sulfitobacter algicola]
MENFPTTARVVIIGGGVVGASSLYHLAQAGWTDCVLLEKNELTAGSTWHAAGNIPTFSSNWTVMNMQRYSTDLYRQIADKVDYPINYNVTGSVRLAHSTERMQEFEHVRSMARAQGMSMDIMSVDDLKAAYPFMETHDLTGGLWDPVDGDMDPAQITQAFAKGARDAGGRILRFTPATGVSRDADEWIVHTEKGDIRCEFIVNAAGYYAQNVGEWFRPHGGRQVPMMVMSHQYMLTDEISEVAEWTKDNGGKLPLLRDVDSSYYLRQEKTGLNLGPYERNCKAHWVTPDDPMPDDFSFQLYPDDLDRLEWYIEDAMARVPLLAQTGISKVINGPIPYSPDGNPLIGPMPGVPNAFETCVYTFGIAQAGGAGKILAEWITEGQTEWDCWSLDPRRFTAHADMDYCIQKGMQVYGHEYAIHFPHQEWPAGRDKKLSSIDAKIREMGGVMGAYNGWERANWFANDGDDTLAAATQTWLRDGPWAERVREECEAVQNGVGVLDLPGFSRFALSGDGAAEWLRSLIAGPLPKVGRMTLGYFPDSRGRILTEMSIIRHAKDEFTLITAAVAQWHDYEYLKAHLAAGLSLTDQTDQMSTLIISGPKSRDLLSRLTDADLTMPWLTHQKATVAGAVCHLLRVSYAGELGWEVHATMADIPAIYDAVLKGEAKPIGMYALGSLRLEKGYRAWKQDLSTDYTLFEGGLDRFVRLEKPQDFPGKAALKAEQDTGPKRRFVTLIIDAGDYDAPHMAPIWHGDQIVGEVTSGGWGYRINASIGLGMVRADLATPGTALEVEIFGHKHKVTVQPDAPLWDPENSRLKA